MVKDINKNIISKSNALIEGRYKMTVNEQKILLATIGMINPLEDKESKLIEFTVKELADLIGVNDRGYYSDLRETTKLLLSRVVEIKNLKGHYIQFQWLSRCRYIPDEGRVEIKIHEEMYPYLLELKEHFTTYKLDNILKLKSKYSIRIYEFMKRYQFKQNFELNLEDIKELFICPDYKTWDILKRKIIEPSIKEINEKTDLLISWNKVKQGRSVVAVEFFIKDKYPKVTKERKERKPKGKQLNFTNYSQREYEYDSLEKQLLGWD